jgi:hypothetical protein
VTFFNSDIVKKELEEIGDLQEKISSNVFSFERMSREEKIEHIQLLESLLEKQQILYTRLSLSDDPDAIQMKSRLEESIKLIGIPTGIQIGDVFKNMISMIESAKQQLQDD